MANTYDMTGVPTGDEWLLSGSGFRGAKAANIYNQRQEELRNAVIGAQEAYEKGIAVPGITEAEKTRLAGIRDDAIYNATVRRYANNPEAITRLQEQRAVRGVMNDLNGLYNGVTSSDPQVKLASAQRLLKDYGNQFLRGGRYEVSLGKNGELLYQAFDGKGNATTQPQPVTPRVLQESFTNAMNFGILRARGNIQGLKDSEAIKTSVGNRVSQAADDARADFVAKDNARAKDTELALEERKAIETARHNRRMEELYDDKNNAKKPSALAFALNEADPSKQWIVGPNGEIIGEKDLKTGQKALFGYDPKEVKSNIAAAKDLGIGYGYQEFVGPNGPTAAYVFSVNGKLARTLDEAKQLLAESSPPQKTTAPKPKQTTKGASEQPKQASRPAVSNVAGGNINLDPKTEAIRRQAGERRRAMRNVEEAISRMFTKAHNSQSPDISR